MVQSVFQADGSEDFFCGKCLFVCGPVGVAQFDGHTNVLCSVEGIEEIMGLEDKTDLAPKLFHGFGAGTLEGLAEDLEISLLDASKCPEEGQEGGFA